MMKKKLAVMGFFALALVAAGGLVIQNADAKAKKEQAAPAPLKPKPTKLVKTE